MAGKNWYEISLEKIPLGEVLNICASDHGVEPLYVKSKTPQKFIDAISSGNKAIVTIVKFYDDEDETDETPWGYYDVLFEGIIFPLNLNHFNIEKISG
jgi:hypothetical protein